MVEQKDYYGILGVEAGATSEEIRQAFLHQALIHHPDRGGSHEKMVAICEAVEVLSDSAKRSLYDRARIDPRNAIVRGEWEAVEHEAAATAQKYPERSEDFKGWLDAVSKDVQKSTLGRILSGFFGGLVFGAVGGAIVAVFLHLPMVMGALIGACTGALGGAFAAASNDPVTIPINRASTTGQRTNS